MTHNKPADASTGSGIRRVLSVSALYSAFQALVGADRARMRFVSEHVRPTQGDAVLDIGCGTGEILGLLGEQRYFGFDPSESYIEAARVRFGQDAKFHVGSVAAPPALEGGFDLAIAVGVLHHLDDSEARTLVDLARDQLHDGGRLITLDPVLVDGQHPLARTLAKRDRGEFVRSPERYAALANGPFESVQITRHDDYLRLPYTHLAMECQ
ncbi:MAG TPA: class I SAM-dependent methyltransferase [Acidimicrobiia bacterium]|nr:class I SAM-dependent methyltransferase [Acidimicrobiia bacterium]